MATLKPTTSVLAYDDSNENNASIQTILQNSLIQSGLNQNLQITNQNSNTTIQNLIRHFDLSTLDRLMNAALSNGQNWSKDANPHSDQTIAATAAATKTTKTNLDNLQSNLNNRKSSRGSEERSSVSDYEVLDEEMIMNEEQSAFLNNVSISPFASTINQHSIANNNQTSICNQIDDNLLDNSTSESTELLSMEMDKSANSFNFNQDSASGNEEDSPNQLNRLASRSSGRRKSLSRLARQTGDGPAKQFTCHFCTFTTENKPIYNAHMDKHYEHRCKVCGYGCRTKGRLNRHIRESHPDKVDELGCGDNKRKKRNSTKINLTKIIELDDAQDLNGSLESSNAASDTTIIDSKLLNDSLDQIKTQFNNHFSQATSNQNSIEQQQQQHQKAISDSIKSTSISTRIKKLKEKANNNINEQQPNSSSSSSGEKPTATNSKESNINRYRKYKCKQCNHVSMNKKESWEHNKVHINKDKLLKCPNCDFNTGFKHHLEYHLRCHYKSKPFRCIKCSYSCINKSMLASHLKSHSNVYQFRCNDCAYATKYCHSLKLHLRKYQHKPDRVLNLDGSENPYPIIDVYGTRRGPRPKKGVGSLKLVKQVLEDNEHVVVDKEKVDQIVSTFS